MHLASAGSVQVRGEQKIFLSFSHAHVLQPSKYSQQEKASPPTTVAGHASGSSVVVVAVTVVVTVVAVAVVFVVVVVVMVLDVSVAVVTVAVVVVDVVVVVVVVVCVHEKSSFKNASIAPFNLCIKAALSSQV